MSALPAEHPTAWAYDVQRASDFPAVHAASGRDARKYDGRPLFPQWPSWLDAAHGMVLDLLADPDVSPKAASEMLTLLQDSAFVGTPAPFIGPSEGGVMAEFRAGNVDLEIYIDESGARSVYALARGESEYEGPLEDLPDGLGYWAWRLALLAQ